MQCLLFKMQKIKTNKIEKRISHYHSTDLLNVESTTKM